MSKKDKEKKEKMPEEVIEETVETPVEEVPEVNPFGYVLFFFLVLLRHVFLPPDQFSSASEAISCGVSGFANILERLSAK